jgi:hypothetical protein
MTAMSELMNELIEQLICEWLEMERNINCRGMTRDEMFACAEKEWPNRDKPAEDRMGSFYVRPGTMS